jgi:hypothetical protein
MLYESRKLWFQIKWKLLETFPEKAAIETIANTMAANEKPINI